jgi:hypothetical protein
LAAAPLLLQCKNLDLHVSFRPIVNHPLWSKDVSFPPISVEVYVKWLLWPTLSQNRFRRLETIGESWHSRYGGVRMETCPGL